MIKGLALTGTFSTNRFWWQLFEENWRRSRWAIEAARPTVQHRLFNPSAVSGGSWACETRQDFLAWFIFKSVLNVPTGSAITMVTKCVLEAELQEPNKITNTHDKTVIHHRKCQRISRMAIGFQLDALNPLGRPVGWCKTRRDCLSLPHEDLNPRYSWTAEKQFEILATQAFVSVLQSVFMCIFVDLYGHEAYEYLEYVHKICEYEYVYTISIYI